MAQSSCARRPLRQRQAAHRPVLMARRSSRRWCALPALLTWLQPPAHSWLAHQILGPALPIALVAAAGHCQPRSSPQSWPSARHGSHARDDLHLRPGCQAADGPALPPAQGWQGSQTLPREVTLDAVTGTLLMTPVPELALLRSELLFSGPVDDLGPADEAQARMVLLCFDFVHARLCCCLLR